VVTAGSDTLTFTNKAVLSTFLTEEETEYTERGLRGAQAIVLCSAARPVRLHYGKDSTMAKFRFTYIRRNSYGNITTAI